jgi:PhzF family phenazine biosynthesis protein
MTLPVAIVDAFTTTPGQGNRAGVVTKADGLDEAAMRAAAKAVAASETAFVFPGHRFRYFTPEAEIPFCGHATVASIHLLAESGALSAPGRFEFHCSLGPLHVEVDDAHTVWIDAGPAAWAPAAIPDSTAMSIPGRDRLHAGDFPSRPAIGLQALRTAAAAPGSPAPLPDWDRLAQLNSTHAIDGVYAFTKEVVEPANVSHGRFFAPAVGIREDPVTGSASVALAHYLARHVIIALPSGAGGAGARGAGDAMGKAGQLSLSDRRTGSDQAVRIGGAPSRCWRGT